MKKSLFLLLFTLAGTFLFSQNLVVDSLRKELVTEKTDTGKIILLCKISNAYQDLNPDSALLVAQEVFFLTKDHKNHKWYGTALNEMATAYNSLGNFPKALEYYLEELKFEESEHNPYSIATIYLSIALLYNNAKDHENAVFYAKRCDSIVNVNNFETLSLYSLLDLGEIYEKKNVLDSALRYTLKCLDKSMKAGNDLITGTALNNLGNIYFKSGKYQESHQNYQAGLKYIEKAGDFSIYAESMLGMARLFEQEKNLDSAVHFGRKSFEIASDNQFILNSLDASVLLTRVFKALGETDSAFYYQSIMIGLRDSIDSREKIKDVQYLTTEEQLRQKEIAQQKANELKDRNEKLQLLLIGLAIPIFFLISVMISRKKVHKKLIEFFGIVSILLLFEYITLLMHPFVAEKTNHSPFFEIIIFVTIAAIITPLHHRFQRWVITKLTEYNYLKHHHQQPTENENVNEGDMAK